MNKQINVLNIKTRKEKIFNAWINALEKKASNILNKATDFHKKIYLRNDIISIIQENKSK